MPQPAPACNRRQLAPGVPQLTLARDACGAASAGTCGRWAARRAQRAWAPSARAQLQRENGGRGVGEPVQRACVGIGGRLEHAALAVLPLLVVGL